MPEYIVKTFENRNLVIEADKFRASYNPHNDIMGYTFFSAIPAEEGHSNLSRTATNSENVVAYVSSSGVLAVVRQDSWKADFYTVDNWDEDESDDVCSDCRFLESEEFFDAVYDAVAVILDDSESEVEHWTNGENHLWGWNTEKGFVNFGDEDYAEENISLKNDETEDWVYTDLTGYTKVGG